MNEQLQTDMADLDAFIADGNALEHAKPVEVVAEPVEAETPVVDPPAEPKVGKPRDDPRARVEAATAKEAAAKRERDEAKAENTRLAAELAALKATPAPKPVAAPVADAEPTVDQFDSYEKFVKAQARWEARQEIIQQETSRHAHEVAQQREHVEREINRTFEARYTAVLEADPEFPTKVDPRLLNTTRLGLLADPSTATFGNFLVQQVFESEHPKELLLHLSDPTVVQRLATLPPATVVRELARFEGRLDAASPAASAPKALPVSHAKAPIRPVGSSPVAADANEISDDLSVDEHIKRANARDAAARRRAS